MQPTDGRKRTLAHGYAGPVRGQIEADRDRETTEDFLVGLLWKV